MSVGVGQILRQAALRDPTRVALVEVRGRDRREVRAAELDQRARRGAAALQAQGVGPGQRVGLMGANSADFVAAWFAVVYAGGVVVPVPVRSAPREIAVRLDHAGARHLIADGPSAQLAARAPWAQGPPRAIALETLAAPAAERPLPFPAEPAAGSAAMILYTSGTTGDPKAAVISHASLVAHTAGLVHHTLRLGREDVVLGALPLTHSFGWRMAALAPLYADATVVLPVTPGGRFHAAETRALMRREGVTWVPAVPTMFAAWARLGPAPAPAPADSDHGDDAPPSRLRWCLSAGAPLAEDVRVRAEAALHPGGVEIRQGYGMTEATFATIDGPRAPQHPGSVGRPVWGVEVRVVDAQGEDVPADGETPGELLIRGTNVMLGYLDDPAATAARVRDGWVHSGDVGRVAPDGWITVVDRTRDIILRGGFTVYPSEVEHVLCEHPAVTEAAAVGRPDPYFGEEIVAFVVTHMAPATTTEPPPLTEASLLRFARERLGADKVPRQIVFVDSLPQGGSGKVLKQALLARLVQRGEAAPAP